MDIAPLYFNYESPDVSKGKMYVHPFEDIKQSQIWKMESENMMNSLPSMMREYLTFDKFDEDTDRYNTIINNFTTEIDRITDDIQANGVTRDNQRAINDLATNINQQMATGDLSLMRDNLASFRAWEAREMEAGKEDPVLYQRMRDSKKNEFLISIGTEQIVSRPNFNDDNIKRSAMFELAKRITQRSAESPIETSWGTEDDLADIINGVFKTEDRGYVQQQAKYLHGIPNPVYENPIIVYEDEKGNRTAIVNLYHPYAKEASEYLAQMRATQKQYEHKVSTKSNGKARTTPGAFDGSQFGDIFSDDLEPTTVDINTAYAFTPIYTLTAPFDTAEQPLDGIKLDNTKRSMIEGAIFNGLESVDQYGKKDKSGKNISEAEDYMNMFSAIRNSAYFTEDPSKQAGFDKAVNNYFYGSLGIEIDNTDWLFDYFNNRAENIEKKYYDVAIGKNLDDKFSDNQSISGLHKGTTVCKDKNGKIIALIDDETGIKYKVHTNQTTPDFYSKTQSMRFVVDGVYIGKEWYGLNDKNIYHEKLDKLRQAYQDYNSRAIRSYRAVVLNVAADSKVNTAVVNNMNNNKKNLVVINERLSNQDEINALEKEIKDITNEKKKKELQEKLNKAKQGVSKISSDQQDSYYGQDSGFKDGYTVVKVNKYIGSVDGIKSVFECEVKKDKNSDKTETMLIGVSDKGSGPFLQYAIQQDLVDAYVNNGDHKIPKNLFYRLTDQNYQDFDDYLTTYTVYDNSSKSIQMKNAEGKLVPKEGENYTDIPLENLGSYLRLNFEKNAYRIRIFAPENGPKEYMLLFHNSETDEWEAIENKSGVDRMDLDELYNNVMWYGLDKSFNKKETLSYDGTTGSTLYRFFENYFPKARIGNYNYSFEFIMKGKSKSGKTYADYPTYYTNLFDHIVLGGLAKTCFNNANKDDITFKSGCSFILAGLFPDLASDPDKVTAQTLYKLTKSATYDNVKQYLSFGKEQNIDKVRDGGELSNLVTTGTILYLPEIDKEGVVYTQYNGHDYVKYVLCAYDGKLEMMPLEKFLDMEKPKTANGKVRHCHIGNVTDKYYNKYMKFNTGEEQKK